jgi:NADH-quinone oxidoreductase subunit L
VTATVLTACVLALPWCGAIAVWLTGDTRPRLRDALAVGFSATNALASVALLQQATSATTLHFSVGGAFGDFTFVPDELGMWMTVIATTIGSLAVVFSLEYMRREPGVARYYALVLVFIGAMTGLVLTGSLLLLLVFWEIVGLCSCALIGFHADRPLAVAGAVRALVVTQVGGIGLLVGILTARAVSGAEQVSDLLANGPGLPAPALMVVGYGFLVAASAKSAQVPFHIWLPGAMEAPTPVSALIHAATMVNAGVYLLLRFSPVFSQTSGWSDAVLWVGVASAVLGALMALAATDVKRVLAYSTISQLGLLFYAIGLNATDAAQLHMLSHAVFKGLLFLCAGAVTYRTGTRQFAQLGGLARRMPLVTAAFVVGALALAGVPILNGFWTKELIVDAGMRDGPAWAFALILVSCGLTALYAARVTWCVFFRAAPSHASEAPRAMLIALAALALATMLSWLVTGWAPVVEVLTSPATLIGLTATVVGGAAWYWRAQLTPLAARVEWLRTAALADFGFVWVERGISLFFVAAAARLQATQTGRLSWNLAALVTGLTAALAVLVYGGVH